ncbi:uncharacterized protein TNCT_134831 [Trichonephila clavata]|uniref:Gustatory receptor n=1 Tax=Trichonephila clavata TaxID=2740835 RepID=A0A8X6IE00_TRICU|nr:uncharacterized protein TNCT_134831 [Trichonephila clavata]
MKQVKQQRNRLNFKTQPVDTEDKLDTIPRCLSGLLCMCGIILRDNQVSATNQPKNKNQKQKSSIKISSLWTRTEFIFFHLYVLFAFVYVVFEYRNYLFYVSEAVDIISFAVIADTLNYRKKSLQEIIKRIQRLPRKTGKVPRCGRFSPINVLLISSILYTALYGLFTFSYHGIGDAEQADSENQDLGTLLKTFLWAVCVLLICGGMSFFICLFVYICLLIDEKLQAIMQSLNITTTPKISTTALFRKQRRMFCSLQKLTSEVNDIFTKIILLWVVKIVLRACLSFYEIIIQASSSDNPHMQETTILDIMYDICHVSIMSMYAGRIVESKNHILDRLVGLCGLNNNQMEHCIKDIHFFVSIVGHSNMAMTVWNIFFLTKGTAITIISGLISYAIIIYQMIVR